jgi:hypothetical protein
MEGIRRGPASTCPTTYVDLSPEEAAEEKKREAEMFSVYSQALKKSPKDLEAKGLSSLLDTKALELATFGELYDFWTRLLLVKEKSIRVPSS